jgi:hypothetical protein
LADNFRYRYGEAEPVVSKPVPTATVIEIGDMISNVPSAAAVAATQAAFHTIFLGVSEQRSRNGDISPIRVNTRGVHEFDCASATFDVGQLVGIVVGQSQQVVAVATENLAIGRVARQYPAATTKVLVEITSSVMHGGPQAIA